MRGNPVKIRGGRATVILPRIQGKVSQNTLPPLAHQNFAGKGGERRNPIRPGSSNCGEPGFFFAGFPGKENRRILPTSEVSMEEEL